MSIRNGSGRIWSYGSNAILSTFFFLGILVFIVLIAERHPWRVDLTETGTFTLSEQTRKILSSINEPVTIKAFFASASQEEAQAKDLLDTYRYHSKKVSFEFIDPDRQPEVANRYEIRAYGTLVLEGYQKKQTVQNADEENITNALWKLTRKEEKKIYLLTGHGERSITDFNKRGYSSARSALERENYEVVEFNLMQQAQVPEDAAAVIIAGPQKPLFEEELKSLESYLKKGGKLQVFLDPYEEGGFEVFLKQYGIELRQDIIIDELSRVFGGSYLLPVVMEYGAHKITEGFGVATFYSEARSVYPAENLPEGVQVHVLASTSPKAWAETNLDLLKQGKASFEEEEDKAGPVPLMVLAEIATEENESAKPAGPGSSDESGEVEEKQSEEQGMKKGYLLVCGDSDFVDNTNLGLSGNGDFFLNAVNFLANEETLITIEPRKKQGRPLVLTQSQANMILWVSLILVPLAVFISGLTVYRIRRSQR